MTALTSLAVLKVNFDTSERDTLEYFVPFVADRLYHSSSELVSLPEITDDVRREFGIAVPAGVVKTILRRCVKRGLVNRETGVYKRDKEKLTAYDLTTERAKQRRYLSSLVRAGVEFTLQRFEVEIDEAEYEKSLLAFVQEHLAPMLTWVVDGKPIMEPVEVEETSTYVVADFVRYVAEKDAEKFEYLTAVVKGSILASALYFPDLSDLSRSLSNLSLYLDTTLLLRASGACGPEFEALGKELIQLARAQGARMKCFEHTLTEVQGVLSACEHAVRRKTGDYHGEATDFMVAAGWEPSDVEEFSADFERRIGALGVRVQEKPEHVEELTVDERRFEELLNEEVHYSNRSALLRDIDSLTAIGRLRGGRQFRQLERAKAVFVTTNTALVRGARRFYRLEVDDRNVIPLALPDFVVTTLLWLKQPGLAPGIPARTLIADSLAAVQPSDRMWRKYVEKIEELRERRAISDTDYTILRQSVDARSLLLVETGGDVDAFTEGTANLVLVRAKRSVSEQAMADLAAKAEELTLAKQELADARAQEMAITWARDARASRFAARVVGVLYAVATIGLLIGLVLTAPWPTPLVSGKGGTGVFVVLFLGAVILLTWAGIDRGVTLRSMSDSLQGWVAARFRRFLG